MVFYSIEQKIYCIDKVLKLSDLPEKRIINDKDSQFHNKSDVKKITEEEYFKILTQELSGENNIIIKRNCLVDTGNLYIIYNLKETNKCTQRNIL